MGEGTERNPFDRAVHLLAARRHTSWELRNKLKQRGFGVEEIDSALSRLRELNYLDDDAALKIWTEELALNSTLSRIKAVTRLMGRSVPHAEAEAAVREAWSDEIERSHAQATLTKMLRSEPTLPETGKGRARLFRRLRGQGFDTEAVQDTLRSLRGTESDEHGYWE